MSQPDQFSQRLQDALADTQQEINIMLRCLQTSNRDVELELLERICTHHLQRIQESITVLCKIVEDYEQDRLDTASLLVIAQWT